MGADQYLLYSLHDHLLVRIQPLFNNPICIHLPSRRHPPQLHLIRAINDQDESPTVDHCLLQIVLRDR
jgi:hypothetical protein